MITVEPLSGKVVMIPRPGGAGVGPRGVPAGLSYKWSTDTSVTDPGAGFIKANNSDLFSSAVVSISYTDQDGNDLTFLIQSWDLGQPQYLNGFLFIQDPVTPTNFAIFTVRAPLVDGLSWNQLTINFVTSGGTLTNNLPVRVFFFQNGAAGYPGSDPGFQYLFKDDITVSDPLDGRLKFNNSDLAAATTLCIASLSASSTLLGAFIRTWDDSTSSIRGYIFLAPFQVAGEVDIWEVTGPIVDHTTWFEIPISAVSIIGGTLFNNNDLCRIQFYRTGDKGDSGLAGSQDTAEISAAMNIPALSLITANGQVADSNNVAHFGKVIGIVMASVLSGAIATAVVEGEVTEPTWSWPGPNYTLFLNGTTLSATPPSSGWSQLIGITRTAQTVFIRLSDPILL